MIEHLILQAGGAAVMFFVLMMLLVFVLVVWTYGDAQVNSSHPPFLWAIVVFFAPLLGIILYLILGRDMVDEETTDSGDSSSIPQE